MLTWRWEYKKGEIVYKDYKVNIYCANCVGALIYEFKEEEKEMYRVMGFWNDMKHLKNCLGLSGKYKGENIYKDVKKVRLNTYYDESLKIAKLFTMSGIKVELYYKKMDNPSCN